MAHKRIAVSLITSDAITPVLLYYILEKKFFYSNKALQRFFFVLLNTVDFFQILTIVP